MGIEQPRLAAIGPLFRGDPGFVPDPDLYAPTGTPNQVAEAVGNGLAVSRLHPNLLAPAAAQAAAAAFFAQQAAAGHMAVNTARSDGNEQGAPDPHAELWGGALALTLSEAQRQRLATLLGAAIAWWAAHIALCRAFWSPAGVRMPCSRAKTPAGQAPRPGWVWDTRCYALIVLGQSGKGGFAGVPPPAADAFTVLESCSALFPQIVAASMQPGALVLATPIRRWARPGGGFVAALVADSHAFYDPMAWMEVDAAGTILAGDRSLANFVPPAGAPVIVGGAAGTAVFAPPAAPPGAATPPAATGGPEPPLDAVEREAIAAGVAQLLLPHSQGALQAQVVAKLRSGPLTAADCVTLAAQVASFEIGAGQAQAQPWQNLIAKLKGK